MTDEFNLLEKLTPSVFIEWRKFIKEKENITEKTFKIRFLMALSDALRERFSESELLKLEVSDFINRKTLLLLYSYSSNSKHILPKEFKIVYLLQQLNLSFDRFWLLYGSVLPINMAKDKLANSDYIPRQTELQRIKDVLISLKQDQSGASKSRYCALVGVGGIGKTYLAAGLGNQRDIRALYPDGIIWLQLSSEHVHEDLSGDEVFQSKYVNLKQVIEQLEQALGSSSGAEQVDPESLDYLVSLCANKSLLIVVDDVWEGEPLKELNRLLNKYQCTHVRVLMTTRMHPIVSNLEVATKHCVEIGPVHDDEAYDMLCAHIDELIPNHFAKELVDCSANWPLLISLINRRLRMNLNIGLEENKEDIYRNIITQLKEGGRIVLHDRSKANKNHYSISKCLLNTFQYLEKMDREAPVGRHTRMKRYLSLCVFPSNKRIPLGVLSIYWKEPLAVVVTICEDLFKLRLIEDVECHFNQDDYVSVSVPLMKYIKDKSKQENSYKNMQRKLIQRFHCLMRKKYLNNASNCSLDEVSQYFWMNYNYHFNEGE